jgi:sodium transport system ATP-binding protein
MIKIEHLSKRFKNVQALNDVSLSLSGGQIFGLLGPNGAGKTTLLRIIATLLKPDHGGVFVDGLDVQTHALAVRQRLGLVNAGMGVYERLSGRENLAFSAELYGLQKATAHARIAQLSAELGIGAWIDQPAGGYSTGMKQKIVIARAVLHEPPVLILDEASNGLDVLARRALMAFAINYRALGKLVIYSTHVMAEAQTLCDHAAILHMGRVIAVDSSTNLRASTPAGTLEDAFFAITQQANQQDVAAAGMAL